MKEKEISSKIEKGVNLSSHTTFKIGGLADYFVKVNNKEDLKEIVFWARDKNLPFFILSGGSNVLFSDKGYRGLVIKLEKGEIDFTKEKLRCFAGNPLRDVLLLSLEKELSGLEWSCGIPGSVGGAVFGNAGAFNFSMEDSFLEAEVLGTKSKETKVFKKEDCFFGYRDSIFKKNKFVILEVSLKLKKEKREGIKKKMNLFLSQRKERQPLGFPCAGSVFKNTKELSAGFLIDKCGLKGRRIGDAVISEKHANFILNLGQAKSEEVIELMKIAKKEVKKKFKIDLEEEIVLMGDFKS